jgi:ADP-L-glycero-D-manno-heptose 6-epimerase
MPETIREKYQYYTCADLTKLRAAGCSYRCGNLDDSVADYVTNYLASGRVLEGAP